MSYARTDYRGAIIRCRHCGEAIDHNYGREPADAKYLHIEDHEDENRDYDHDPQPNDGEEIEP